MKTTSKTFMIRLDPEVLKVAKLAAINSDTKLRTWIEKAIIKEAEKK